MLSVVTLVSCSMLRSWINSWLPQSLKSLRAALPSTSYLPHLWNQLSLNISVLAAEQQEHIVLLTNIPYRNHSLPESAVIQLVHLSVIVCCQLSYLVFFAVSERNFTRISAISITLSLQWVVSRCLVTGSSTASTLLATVAASSWRGTVYTAIRF